jgi:hypothetical protein
VIYFFAKGPQFTQCEIHPGQPHLLRVIAPDGAEKTEHYACSQQLQDRYAEIANALCRDGWSGPLGRDARL